MDKDTYQAREFQLCTILKVWKELFESKGKNPKRFLVADEVGLGKTIIAKHVIKLLREKNGARKRTTIIYVSSSLDITKQNRTKLAENADKEIIHTDRITLLYERERKSSGVQIYSMTPSTSLCISNSLGNQIERRYIAWLILQMFGVRKKQLIKIFHHPARAENFEYNFERYPHKQNMPSWIFYKIQREWEKIRLANGQYFAEALIDNRIQDETSRELVKRTKLTLAKCLLETIEPDLIIFDEFQKFKELTQINDFGEIKHVLGKILLKPTTPTLLLSATPYRLFTDHRLDQLTNESTGHYDDLKEIFAFLNGSNQIGSIIVKKLSDYGRSIEKICKNNVREILLRKRDIESTVMKFMSRAERINFEGNPDEVVSTKFMSNSMKGIDISKNNILEFLKLAKHVSSKMTLLTYWKSGVTSMSYMEKYKLIEDCIKNSRKSGKDLKKDNELYSKFKKHDSQHLKIKYLFKNILNSGENYKYLWIPPSNPYYVSHGIFQKNVLEKANERTVKKGLIFSSWAFVPKMVASELSAMRNKYFKHVPKKDIHIDSSAMNWGLFYFPSHILMKCLTHADFIEAKTFRNLLQVAKSNLKELLQKHGIKISPNGQDSQFWRVLRCTDFDERDKLWRSYSNLLKGVREHHLLKKDHEGAPVEKDSAIFNNIPIESITDKLLMNLANAAITSPSVCIYRSLYELNNQKIDDTNWLYLSAFCIHEIRSFLNRQSTFDAMYIKKGNLSPSKMVQRYFKEGNFQAVIDEYLYLVYFDKSPEGTREIIKKLSLIFAPRRSYYEIKTSYEGKPKRVFSDIISAFGEGTVDANSRDITRESFNSPFWPMVLATTSVGQEGLDFHLYCKDIYHWNLPTNPVDFEQREGRINRFNNFMIRKNIMRSQSEKKYGSENKRFIWDLHLENATESSHRNDRYNLEMSPNWVYTSNEEKKDMLHRHILDLPCSNDRDKYKRLIEDLSLYRLALGQPNQREFMDKLRKNNYYGSIDPRGIILNFFPYDARNRKNITRNIARDHRRIKFLIDDCKEYLKDLKGNPKYKDLKKHVDINIELLIKLMEIPALSVLQKQQFEKLIFNLFYFVDPHDDKSDRSPEIGFDDDLDILFNI